MLRCIIACLIGCSHLAHNRSCIHNIPSASSQNCGYLKMHPIKYSRKINTYFVIPLFNNAGIVGPVGPIANIDIKEWDNVISINLSAVFYGMHFQIPAILRAGGGNIVNTASIMGQVAAANQAGYNTAKHGVVGLTKTAALEYSDQ